MVPIGSLETSEEDTSLITLVVSLLCLCIIVGHLFENNRWVNQATIAITLGCTTGFTMYAVSNSSQLLQFNEQLFFIYLLPPIIFNAGFQVKKKQFFHNFGTIMLFGGSGVFISTAIVTAGCRYLFPKLNLVDLQMKDYLAIGTIFSATDTVATLQVLHQDETPLLYSLVFGEGVVNGATSIVLFRAVQRSDETGLGGQAVWKMAADFVYLFTSSTILGVVVGLIAAYTLKTIYFERHSTDREIAIMVLMAYLSYMLAELCHLSGMLAVFFCGILMSHYSWHNVSESSKITSKHVFATMSFICESLMFLYVGKDVFNVNIWSQTDMMKDACFIWAILLGLMSIGRAAFVFPFSVISNWIRGTSAVRLTLRHQVIIWWAGIMRGAVSIALAYKQFTTSFGDGRHAIMLCSTTGVVIFTTVILGVFTKLLIEILLPHHMREDHYPREPANDDDYFVLTDGEDGSRLRRRSSLGLLLANPTSAVHSFWRSFDDLYMRPVFGGGGFVRDKSTWEV